MSSQNLTLTEKRRLAVTAALVVCTAALWFAWPHLRDWQRSRLAHELVQRAEQSEAPTSRRAIEALAKLGPVAIRPLVKLAASEQVAAAQPAQRQLNALVAHWELLLVEDIADESIPDQMVLLAEGLAVHASELGPLGQRWAERIVMRLLSRASIASASQSLDLLAACDQTLSAIPPRGAQSRNHPATAQQMPPSEAARLKTPEVDMTLLAGQSATLPDRYADSLPTPAAVPLSEIVSDVAESQPPRDLNWHDNRRPLVLPTPPDSEPLQEEVTPTPDRLEPDQSAQAVSIRSPQETKRLVSALSKRSSRELIVELATADRYLAAAIRQALELQGYSAAELTLAKRLASTEVEDRRALMDLAADLPADAARRLLTALIEDPDAGIRLEALTRFATSGDPRVEEIAERRLQEDDDPRVADLAGRILKNGRR